MQNFLSHNQNVFFVNFLFFFCIRIERKRGYSAGCIAESWLSESGHLDNLFLSNRKFSFKRDWKPSIEERNLNHTNAR